MAMTVRQQKIHAQALAWVAMRKRSESGLVANLIENQKEKVYGCFGKTSVFDYLIDVLGLSEPVASSFNTVFRKAIEVPELSQALCQGRISICKASRIVSVLDNSNAHELLELASQNSWRAVETEMARRKPSKAGREKIKPVNEHLVEVKLYMTADEAKDLRRAQDLLSSKRRHAVSLSQTAAQSFSEYVIRHDPVKRAARAQERNQKRAPKLSDSMGIQKSTEDSVRTDSDSGRNQRIRLTAEQTHAVNACDKGQCTFVDEQGKRCKNERWLEMHHIVRVSEGGSNDPSNLKTLCWYHHDLTHQLELPIVGQISWIKDYVRSYEVCR